MGKLKNLLIELEEAGLIAWDNLRFGYISTKDGKIISDSDLMKMLEKQSNHKQADKK